MFGFGKNKSRDSSTAEKGLFGRLRAGLSKTRGVTQSIANLVVGRKQIDDDLLEDLETHLLTADVGVEATQSIISDLTQRVARKQLNDPDALLAALHDDMQAMLAPVEQPLHIPQSEQPFVLLMVGINGAGKTTSIGKIARHLQDEGRSVMLAAGDTFRAAAVEQLQTWGERNQVPVIAQQQGSDSASVICENVRSGKATFSNVFIESNKAPPWKSTPNC